MVTLKQSDQEDEVPFVAALLKNASDRHSATADGQHVPNVGRQCCLYLTLSSLDGWTAGLDALDSRLTIGQFTVSPDMVRARCFHRRRLTIGRQIWPRLLRTDTCLLAR